MKRIILHWTAGTYEPNSIDLSHYHFLFNGNGDLILGIHKVEDNENCTDGNYAAHTGGGNTGSIGVALCGMLGYENPSNQGKYPLKQIQFERAYELCAELSKRYNIPLNRIMTHYEFGINNPTTSSKGKIDINFIPYNPSLKENEVGDFIRGKIQWYLN